MNRFSTNCYEILTKVIITCYLIYISISIDQKKKRNLVQYPIVFRKKKTRETEIWNKVKISSFGYTDQITYGTQIREKNSLPHDLML